MKETRNIFISMLLVVICFMGSYAQLAELRSDESIVSWAEQYTKNASRFDHFNGVVLIARNGQPIFWKAFGLANHELDAANNRETKFRIGSISKQFTATAVLQLHEKGALNINDPVCQYLKDCPPAWKPITIRQLLNHTSGLVNFTALPVASGDFLKTAHTQEEVVNTFRSIPLESVPGEQFNYNNSGYYLLGMIIEKVSGMGYAEYLGKYIYAPLGMKNTGFDDQHTVVKNKATGYYLGSDSVFHTADYTNMQLLFSIGGLYSTVHDLLLWEQSFSTEKLLRRSTIQDMFTPGKGDYGYGWWIDKPGNCDRMYHDGGITHFSSSLQRIPGQKLTVIAISNGGDDGGIRVAYDIAGRICGIPATVRGIQAELMSMEAEKLVSIVTTAKAAFPIFDIQEKKVEEIGNYLMLLKKNKQAIEVFKLNVYLYPKSAAVYYKLAMAYKSAGNKRSTLINFRKCLELDPANKSALAHIRDLE